MWKAEAGSKSGGSGHNFNGSGSAKSMPLPLLHRSKKHIVNNLLNIIVSDSRDVFSPVTDYFIIYFCTAIVCLLSFCGRINSADVRGFLHSVCGAEC